MTPFRTTRIPAGAARLGRLLAAAALLLGAAHAQANVVPGLDGRLYDIASATVWGREGPAHPGGVVGFSAANSICNPGSVAIPWYAAMAENHPMFGFLVARLHDDRIVQVSDRSYCKHAFTSVNNSSGPCLPCQYPGTGTLLGVGCSDAYGANHNANRSWLGPADEIDPWLGTWSAVGSYFDRGDPDVGPPANHDGIRSSIWITSPVENRVTIAEQDLLTPGAQYFYQVHLLHRGEAAANRGDNLMSREAAFLWTGLAWMASDVGAATTGSLLTRWPGATVTGGGNGGDDGRVLVAVKVTGPVDGMWHYEYAVHNVDNSRGVAAFRLPVCQAARVQGLGFRDIDDNALNQWTATVQAGEIAFAAPPDNALRWNMLFNFWFDSDAAPAAGAATMDQALLGPGALSFPVATTVPGEVPNVWLGAGCGQPAPQLFAAATATIPAPGFALGLLAAPGTPTFTVFNLAPAALPLAPGCTQYVDGAGLATFGFALTGLDGRAALPLPIPPGLLPMTVHFQAVTLEAGGPILGAYGVSNGLAVRIGLAGCP